MSGRFEENYRFEDSGFDDTGGCGCEKHSAVREAHLREGRPVREHEMRIRQANVTAARAGAIEQMMERRRAMLREREREPED